MTQISILRRRILYRAGLTPSERASTRLECTISDHRRVDLHVRSINGYFLVIVTRSETYVVIVETFDVSGLMASARAACSIHDRAHLPVRSALQQTPSLASLKPTPAQVAAAAQTLLLQNAVEPI